ncbi:MAG: ATP-binding protein [Candidatus Micrarchaeota archaeon]
MYFEIEPKSKKADFFNHDYEYEQLKKALERKEKIIAVVGVRRVGKTSLLNVVYHETKTLKLWLDGRIVTSPKKEIFAAIYETAKSGKPRIFGHIDSLNVSAFGIGLNVKVGSQSQIEIEKKVRSAGRMTVFIDEAQRMKTDELADVLSYFYDRFPGISFVISGSEIGLVEEILGESDGEHPLYGREITKIMVERLDKNRAMDFLRSGFAQIRINITDSELEEAISELDGLIGWLTLYGYEKGVRKNADALKKTSTNAAQIVATELVHFFKNRKNKKLYLSILRNTDGTAWEELMNKSSKDYGKKLNNNSFASALANLVSYSFVEKKDQKYYLSDPLLKKAIFLV